MELDSIEDSFDIVQAWFGDYMKDMSREDNKGAVDKEAVENDDQLGIRLVGKLVIADTLPVAHMSTCAAVAFVDRLATSIVVVDREAYDIVQE